MEPIYIVLIVIASIIALFLIIEFIFYYKVFYNDIKEDKTLETNIIRGEKYKNTITAQKFLISRAQTYKYEDVFYQSEKKINLHARFYKGQENSPYVICIPGYKGNALNNFAGGMPYYVDKGYNVLLIDNRGHGQSSGHTITFGIKDRKDVRKWVDYLIKKYGDNIKIIIVGISMGGATTLMMGDTNLPNNVVGLIADCPYASAKDEIKYCIKDRMHLPGYLLYPVWLSALIFGQFRLNETDAYRSIKKTNLPILIIHGDIDSFVPISASRSVKDMFPNQVTLVEVKGAPHGISFIVDNKTYTEAEEEYLKKIV